MKKALLIYYTGTFNTRYVSKNLKQKLEQQDYEVELYEINPLNNEVLDLSSYDLIGLGYPIYGFNAPYPFLKFVRKQKFPKGVKTFIYKNSGETYKANDASSINIYHKLKRCKTRIDNEYHFMMPYNIHFRFDENLVKEMLDMDDKLMDILVHEIVNDIPNIKKYRAIDRFVTAVVKLQFIGGDINSFFYRIDKKKCIDCDLCIKNCPTKNIYRNKKNKIRFHHHCLMCMRCSFFCPKNAIHIGYLEGWKVNGRYDFEKIKKLSNENQIITPQTEGFFKCYIATYDYINNRYEELGLGNEKI